jgi:hypothetical protein
LLTEAGVEQEEEEEGGEEEEEVGAEVVTLLFTSVAGRVGTVFGFDFDFDFDLDFELLGDEEEEEEEEEGGEEEEDDDEAEEEVEEEEDADDADEEEEGVVEGELIVRVVVVGIRREGLVGFVIEGVIDLGDGIAELLELLELEEEEEEEEEERRVSNSFRFCDSAARRRLRSLISFRRIVACGLSSIPCVLATKSINFCSYSKGFIDDEEKEEEEEEGEEDLSV